VIIGVECREDEHTGIADALLGNESPGPLEAIHHGHADVHDDDSGSEADRALEGFATVRRFADDLDALFAAEDHAKPGPDELLVVDKEDSDRHEPTARSSIGSRAITRNPVAVCVASNVPPNNATRSRMPSSPRPSCADSTAVVAPGVAFASARVSSSIVIPRASRSNRTVTDVRPPAACFKELVSPSWTIRYAESSRPGSSGRGSPSMTRSTACP